MEFSRKLFLVLWKIYLDKKYKMLNFLYGFNQIPCWNFRLNYILSQFFLEIYIFVKFLVNLFFEKKVYLLKKNEKIKNCIEMYQSKESKSDQSTGPVA